MCESDEIEIYCETCFAEIESFIIHKKKIECGLCFLNRVVEELKKL